MISINDGSGMCFVWVVRGGKDEELNVAALHPPPPDDIRLQTDDPDPKPDPRFADDSVTLKSINVDATIVIPH